MASKRDHGTGFADAVAATLVAALALPILRIRTGTGITDLPVLVQAGVLTLGVGSVGALLGATVGVGLWKRVLVARATGARARIAPAVGGSCWVPSSDRRRGWGYCASSAPTRSIHPC